MSIIEKNFIVAVLIVVIVLIRKITLNKLPKKTFLFLWGVTVCRLLAPCLIASRFSFYNNIDIMKNSIIKNNHLPNQLKSIGVNIANVKINMTPSTEEYFVTKTSSLSISMFLCLWLIGMVTLSIFFIITYIRCLKEFRTSLPIDKKTEFEWLKKYSLVRNVQIRQSDKISTPLTYGVIRPVILIPKSIDWTDEVRMRYIFTHEFTHIKCFDILKKLILTSVLCVYWYNPFVWIMYILANRDIELSCDETVVKTFGETMKSAYAMALIDMEENKNKLTLLCSNFNKNAIDERIVSIMKMNKTSHLGRIKAFVLVICVSFIFATNAAGAINDTQENGILMSINKSSGSTKVSIDDGKTWMDEAEYLKLNPVSEVEWWSYDEYKAWLDKEKENLKLLVNAPGWSQKRVDSAIDTYEQTLERIKNGALVSKEVNGDQSIGYESNNPVNTGSDDIEESNTSVEGIGK